MKTLYKKIESTTKLSVITAVAAMLYFVALYALILADMKQSAALLATIVIVGIVIYNVIKGAKPKTFLCYQLLVVKDTQFEGKNYIGMDVAIRKVTAKTEKEALEKFHLETADLKVDRRLETVCFSMDELISIE